MKKIFPFERPCLMGIGNRSRGDDGAGSVMAERFKGRPWKVIDAGSIPESCTGIIRKTRPDLLVVVDACDMGAAAGEYRRIDKLTPDMVVDTFTTHQMPLHLLISYLATLAGKVVFIGIQPKEVGFSETLSVEAETAIEEIMTHLKAFTLDGIRAYP